MASTQQRRSVGGGGATTEVGGDAPVGGVGNSSSTRPIRISKASAKEIQVKLAADRFTKRRKQMNGKGVFDDSINQTRAGVMLLCESESYGRSGKKKGEPDQNVLARLMGKGGAAGGEKGEQQSKIERLASTLENLHAGFVEETALGVQAARTKERQERVRVVVGGPAPSAPTVHVHAPSQHVGGRESPQVQAPPASILATPAAAKHLLTSGGGVHHQHQHHAAGSMRVASVFSVENSRTTSSKGVHSGEVGGIGRSGRMGSVGNNTTSSSGGGGIAPAPAPGTSKLTVSDWMQRNHEHQRYPEAEKDARAMLRRRDESKRSATPVERYTTPWLGNNPKAKNWEDNSARLSMEKTFTPASLADYRGQSDGSPVRTRPTEALSVDKDANQEDILSGNQDLEQAEAQQHSASTTPVPGGGRLTDFTQTMSTHKGLLEHGADARRARASYRQNINRELQNQQGMLAEGMQRELDPESGGGGSSNTEMMRDEDYESSNEGEEDAAMDRGMFDKDGEGVTNIVDELSYKYGSHTELSEACNLIECTVVCLCEEASQKARTGVTRDHAILRNILLAGLAAMYPSILKEVKKKSDDVEALKNKSSQGGAPSPPVANYRHMRSWSKGVETLLLFDLGLSGVPFSIHISDHVDLLVTYYCSLYKQKQERTRRLMDRWRKNKETEESLAFHTRQQKNEQQEAKQHLADGLLSFMQNSSAITGEDLSALDVGSANIKYRQREVAQSFLDRFEHYLPTTDRKKLKSDEKENMRNKELDSVDPMPRYSSFDAAPPAAKSTLRLRHVLLQYVGLLNTTNRMSPGNVSNKPGADVLKSVNFGGTAGGGKSSSTLPISNVNSQDTSAPIPSAAALFSVAGGVSENAITQFINIFKMTWSQTPLSKEVDVSESHERNSVMEGNRVINLIELYLGLLSVHLRDNFRFRVKAEKRRVEELERRLSDEARAFSVVAQKASGKPTHEEKELAAKVSALHDVERKHLIEKYSKSHEDKHRLERLRKAIENSEEWHGYNALGRIPLEQVIAENGGSGEEGGGGKSPTGGGSEGTVEGGGSPSTTTADDPAKNNQQSNRLEVVRIRKLRELDSCWKSLKIPYGTQIALQDKWNKAVVKEVDRALRLYKECVQAVEAREATVKAVYENEKCQNTKERTINRHQIFSQMCAAGQVCEVVARKLQLEVEDTLMYRDQVYLIKLKEDFTTVSKLLRS